VNEGLETTRMPWGGSNLTVSNYYLTLAFVEKQARPTIHFQTLSIVDGLDDRLNLSRASAPSRTDLRHESSGEHAVANI